MRAQGLRLLSTSVLLVLFSAATLVTPITAQGRLAPGSFDCSSVTEIPTAECQALVALYDSTNGPGWTCQTGWLATTTPCTSWSGVDCRAGHVEELYLISNQLTGTIPPELGKLAYLQRLVLFSNQLTGASHLSWAI
jgi:Leucine Rich Repeat